MQAIIYRPTKTAMQSGIAKTKFWILEFPQQDQRFVENVMGWVSSRDMQQEVKLRFETKEEAIAYATKHKLDYQVKEPNQRTIKKKSYSANYTKAL